METMYPGIAFSPQTRLTQPVSEDDTIINVESTAVFPSGSGYATLGTDESAETVWYAQKTETVLSGCKRGVEGIPRQWQIGEPIARYFTNEDYKTLCGGISELDVRASALEASTEDHAAKLKTLDGQVIHTYTHTLTGTVHKLTGTGEIVQFQATADFHDGDTFTVNGKPAEAVDLTGSPLSASYYLRDSWVLAAFYGGKLHFQGHNLTAKENLLINGDFKINQQGQASYTPGRYTVDCWRFTGNGTKTLYVRNGYLEVDITTPGIWTNVFQTVEYLPAGTYTVSFQLSDYSKINYIYISGSINFWFSHFNSNVVTATFTATEEQKNISIGVQLKEEAGNNLKIYAAKLEKGMHFTGFTTPDPALEMARCQRYLQVYKTYLPSVIVTPTRHNKPEVYIFTPTTMRINPTVTIESEMQIRGAGVGEVLTQSMLTGTNCLPNAVRLVFDNYTGTALTINNVYSVGGLSGRVILSAEL